MEHMFDQPRSPVDDFERTLINAFTTVRAVDAIWVRDTQIMLLRTGELARDDKPKSHRRKTYTRRIWLILARQSPAAVRQIESLYSELQVRTLNEDFDLDLELMIDDLPPAAILPSCIWRRAPLAK